MVPVVRKRQKSTIELFGFGILPHWRVCRVVVTVDNFCNLAVLDPCRTVPGVHNVLVLVWPNLAKNDHLPIFLVGYWNHFANCGHPATNQAVVELPGFERLLEWARILNGMISPCVPAVVNGSHIIGFFGAHKCRPCARIFSA